MRRPPPTAPISADLLKHFAFVTVALTLVVAMFADNSNRQAVASAIVERKAAHDAHMAAAQAAGHTGLSAIRIVKPKPIIDDSPVDGPAGGPMGGGGNGIADAAHPNDPMYPRRIVQVNQVRPPMIMPTRHGETLTQTGVTPDQLPPGAKQDAQRKRTYIPPTMTQKQIDAMKDASRTRSGKASSDE